jgi:uncharacterized protein YwgA
MERREKIIALFREIGFRPDITRFDDRLVAQKVVCLLEMKGLELGYPYSMYVRGPYSPDLTTDLYAFRDDFHESRTGSVLNARERGTADDLLRIFGLKPALLEIGATYGYYTTRERCDPLEALKRVRLLKPFYPEAQIAIGISKAKEFLFEPASTDLDELKKETGPWQQAALRSLRH